MSPSVNISAGAWDLTAPQLSASVCSLKASRNRGPSGPYVKRLASKRKEAVPVPVALPDGHPEPFSGAILQGLHRNWLRVRAIAFVAIVVRSRGECGTKPGSASVVDLISPLAKMLEVWKVRKHWLPLAPSENL